MSTLRFADSHTHLDMPEFADDQEQIIEQARVAGVELMINVGISLDNSRQVLATVQERSGLYAAVGIHPHGASTVTEEALAAIADLLERPKVVALGEIGLDFYRLRSPAALQETWFRRFLDLAAERQKPVIIHTREATEATLNILREYRGRLRGGVMHCFSGNYEEARLFLDLGLEISFSGVLTYPNAKILQEAARRLPLDRLLIETDAPYLSPQPRRGRRNEPGYVVFTAQALAELKSLPLETIAQQTWNNTCRLFGLDRRVK
ncbi:TatD family hydrolase [Desulfobacca acetoxidans]|uniref:Hydrolase, TatD family n=1 Tax=Desulfobacca acetoxidans (strain ATCC 700848 / DSM 11109 / ASRB2) TaxID=880072 RepID=F2NHQ2_DESAR|nr:TatD family hydrolase [Desulfobacca acetoxidans]AEB09239.1 hydrolase, TatD family [Desulfobacca acetoxidans DSM 11109]